MMWSTVLAVYVGMSIYFGVERLLKAIKNKTIEDDIDRHWEIMKRECVWFKMEYLRKKNRKK